MMKKIHLLAPTKLFDIHWAREEIEKGSGISFNIFFFHILWFDGIYRIDCIVMCAGVCVGSTLCHSQFSVSVFSISRRGIHCSATATHTDFFLHSPSKWFRSHCSDHNKSEVSEVEGKNHKSAMWAVGTEHYSNWFDFVLGHTVNSINRKHFCIHCPSGKFNRPTSRWTQCDDRLFSFFCCHSIQWTEHLNTFCIASLMEFRTFFLCCRCTTITFDFD